MATFTVTSQKNKSKKDKRRKFDCFSTKISSCHKPQLRKACSNNQTIEKNHINIFPPPPITPTNYWQFSSSLPLPSNQNATLAKLKNTTTNNNNSQSNCTYDPVNNKQLQQQHPPQCLCLMSPMLHQTSDNLMKCCCSNSITNLERTIFLRCDSPQLCRMASQPAAGEMEHVENSNIFDQSLITDAGNVSCVFINSRSRTNGVLSLKSDCDSGERMINRNVIESEELASINASDVNMLPNNNNNNNSNNNNNIKNNNHSNENALSNDFNVDVISNNSNNNTNDAQSFCHHSDFPFFLDVQINNNNQTNNIKVNKDHRKDKTNTLGKEKHSKQNRYQTRHHQQQQQQQQQQPHLDQQHDHQRCSDNTTTFLSLDPVSYLHADYKKLV
ncbi:hypothetical protein HELRODRAFT_160539 [Helobdella robusta]|uniref:Uncharacterized protein n=1 Tax=Helobdella robusta TaxID=6412 RepID=T1EQE0_HELRO|nr:hypothetical protein HELRODRAFT_160539 [Helobdella robusta]ESO06372.1 hypothetical protein HELRODRAFT_160539 [Helobdella robusta]